MNNPSKRVGVIFSMALLLAPLAAIQAGYDAAVLPKGHEPMPAPVDPRSYWRGRFGSISAARIIKGFTLVPSWKPADGKGTRAGFVNVPALVGTEPGRGQLVVWQ